MSPFDHFSAIAPFYARAVYSGEETLREVASLPVKGRLLDVGGGTGRVSAAIRDLVNEVVVADVSLGMLKYARHFALEPVCCGSESLPFADNTFERVIMVDALHHVINQVESAWEMLRVLKPEGLLVIEEPDIRTFGVKLIALTEKLLLMRSHFLTPDEIMKLFAVGESKLTAKTGTAWVIVKKLAHPNSFGG